MGDLSSTLDASGYFLCGCGVASLGCGHPATAHHLAPEDGLPAALWSAPCTVGGCDCGDYDGPTHPQRPSLADLVISRDDFGGAP